MPDRLRDIIARIGEGTGQNLLDAYDQGRKKPEKKPKTPELEDEAVKKEIDETREQLPNRSTKKAFDRALKNLRPKNQTKEAKRNRANDIRRLHKLQKRLEKTHGPGTVPELISSHLYKQTWQCVADSTGAAVIMYLDACPHPIAKTRIRRTALCPDDQGNYKYSFAGNSRGSVRARAVAALGLLLLGLSRTRNGRKGRWKRLVKGIPLRSLREALTHPAIRDEIPHVNTLIGKHRSDPKNILTDGGVGYLRALKNSDFCYSMQAHWRDGDRPSGRAWKDITQNEIVPGRTESGWKVSLPRYWIISEQYTSPSDAKIRAEMWIDHIAGTLPDDKHAQPERPQTSQKPVQDLSPPPPS